MNAIVNSMERTVTRNLLKYAAGQTMFCPACDDVLDYRRAALVEIGQNSRCICTKCLDRVKSELGEKLTANPHIKITDGRDFK